MAAVWSYNITTTTAGSVVAIVTRLLFHGCTMFRTSNRQTQIPKPMQFMQLPLQLNVDFMARLIKRWQTQRLNYTMHCVNNTRVHESLMFTMLLLDAAFCLLSAQVKATPTWLWVLDLNQSEKKKINWLDPN